MFLRNIQKTITYLLLLLTLCNTVSAQSGQIAFPGAEGAGKFTTGGRGTATAPTTVFEVTSLADDGSAGTLRYALSQSATYRTIVFRVSGTIHLTSKLNIRANTTLAGQTAPGDGICVADYPVVISGDNVIVRYMRFRMGDRYQNKGMVDGAGSDDALGGLGVSNVIVDHCSVSWSTDEALTIYRGDNLTIQWSFITEPLNYSYHFESGDTDFEHHGYGGIWGAKHGSMHHNLIADCRNRNPRFAGISTYTPNTVGVENCDLRNNVIYNWGINTVYGGEGGNYNVVNNYYKYGPSTSSGVRYRVATPSKTTTEPYGKWYIDGNYVYGSSSVTADNWSGVQPDGGAVDIPLVKATAPFDVGASINTQSATEAYESVLLKAGCSLPNRDTLDQRIVNDVRNGTGRIIDVQGGYPHGTPYEETVNAWPALASTTPPVDSDHDGMPDSWETANGLNPANAADRNNYDVSGYTMLEKYLNSLSSTSSTVDVSGSMTSFTQTVGTPSPTQAFSVSGSALTGPITITAPASYELSLNGGATWSASSSPLTLNPTNGAVAATTISVRLNAATAGNYNGNIQITSPGAYDVTVAMSGEVIPVSSGPAGLLQHWPLDINAQDSAAVRSAGVAASTPTFNKLYLSNESTLLNTGVPMPKYSYPFGQAFGASTNGDGTWSTGVGGPGGNLNRTFYEQFTITASAGYSVRVDSIVLSSAFYNTSSNTKLAVVYSRSGFSTDSADVTGGTGPAGALASTANGAFATPILLANQTAGPTNSYSLALNNASGVTLAAGETLTIRLYFSCGSSSNGRYGMLKDVKAIGLATGQPVATPAITTSGTLSAFSQTVGTPSPTQTYTVSGANLTGDLTVTPPAAYEVSTNGTTWYTATSPLVLTPAGGSVAGTTISVRLNAGAAGSYSGSIAHTATGAATQNVTVSGTATAPVIVTPPPAGTNVVVAKDGTGNYTTVQAAIDAAPTNSTTPYVIYIKNGKYKEKITIPSNKPFIHLIGESVANTILTYDDYSGKAMPGGGTYGTANSASVTVNAPDCFFANITFENTTGDAPQALAINVSADRVVLVNCRFLGGQDTVLAYNSGRSYFKNCYIDGTVDFIFGNGKAVFDSTIIYPKTRQDGLSGSYITAANTPQGQAYGFVFRDCVIPANFGTTSYVLGRPWQNDGAVYSPVVNNKTVFINTTMAPNIVKPEGWSTWAAGTNTSLIYYGEYRSRKFDSTLVDVSARVPWSYQLTQAEASTYTNANIFGSWDPCSVSPLVCSSPARAIAVSNFKAKKGSSSTPSVISWNISWPMTGITYELYRSSDKVTFTRINEQVAADDVNVNFSYSEAIPPAGSTYYYYVRALKSGLATHLTDTVLVSSTPTITVTGSLGTFKQGVGTPSAVQAYTVSGVNLTAGVTITPPAGYEVSTNGTTWYNNTSPLVLPQTGGALASTTISVRLNAATAGTYTGNIVHTSTGAADATVTANGTVQTDPLPTPAVVLQHWPMNLNNQDSADVRSAGVLATIPTFNNLYISNGTAVTTIPSYSYKFGQAFGASTNGDGSWGTAIGGPGGNLNRIFYEQFTVTAATGYQVKVDSLVLSEAFYNTSSNTKLAVAYSKSGFATDSADVTGGTGPAGALLSTANGAFATPIALANQTGGPTNTYTLALADATGVTLAPGETLTVRIYNSCGSTSVGRYAMLKDVRVKGAAFQPPVLTVTGTLNNFNQSLGTPSVVQTYKVSGVHLQNSVTITPPADYEVSADGGATWFSNATPLVIAPVSGAVAEKTISVRLNATTAGSYAGNITTASSGLSNNTAVSGTAAAATLTVSGTLAAFNQILGSPSAVQTYTVSGTALVGAVTITPPASYQVSADGGTTWFTNTTPMVLQPVNGTLAATTVSVRLNATATGTFAGSITNASAGATSRTAAVNGTAVATTVTVTAALDSFIQVLGTPSPVKTYTVSGRNLTANLTVTPPAGYEVSADGGTTWYTSTSPLVLTQTGGTLAETTITVRLNAAATGTYSGGIDHTNSGNSKALVPVAGIALRPAIAATSALNAFSQTLGTPSAVQSYTIEGNSLMGSIRITPPAAYQVSVDGKVWFTSSTPLVLNPVGRTVAATRIYVRLNAGEAGSFAGAITHTSTAQGTVSVSVEGMTHPMLTISPNPATSTLSVYHPKVSGTYQLSILSIAGLKVASYSTTSGSNLTTLNVSGLPAGVYYLEFLQGSSRTLLKFVKQ